MVSITQTTLTNGTWLQQLVLHIPNVMFDCINLGGHLLVLETSSAQILYKSYEILRLAPSVFDPLVVLFWSSLNLLQHFLFTRIPLHQTKHLGIFHGCLDL